MEELEVKNTLEIISTKLSHWIESIINMLPNLLLALIIVVLSYFVAKSAKKISAKLFSKTFNNQGLSHLLQNIIYLSVIIIGVFIALGVLELDKTVTSLLAGVGVIGLALGFAFQDTASNFVAGFFLALKSPIEIGDIIQTSGITGLVQRISLRSTLVRTFQGTDVVIPNKDVFQNPLYNYSHSQKRRIDLECGISYGDDLEKVKQITLKAIENTPGIDRTQKIVFYFQEFGDSSINFLVGAWSEKIDQTSFLTARSNMVIQLKKAFDENDIMIPFPIRTLDFGIRGGEKLATVLKEK